MDNIYDWNNASFLFSWQQFSELKYFRMGTSKKYFFVQFYIVSSWNQINHYAQVCSVHLTVTWSEPEVVLELLKPQGSGSRDDKELKLCSSIASHRCFWVCVWVCVWLGWVPWPSSGRCGSTLFWSGPVNRDGMMGWRLRKGSLHLIKSRPGERVLFSFYCKGRG